jgi:hypothetical protein
MAYFSAHDDSLVGVESYVNTFIDLRQDLLLLSQHDIWHVEAGHMRTRVIVPQLSKTAHPEAFPCGTPPSSTLPRPATCVHTRGGARRGAPLGSGAYWQSCGRGVAAGG